MSYPNQSNNNSNYKQGYKSGFYKKPQEEEVDMDNPKIYKAYVGTGNRDVPDAIKNTIKSIATKLEAKGYTLRTGGLDGSEAAFETDIKLIELHLPWKGFNDKDSKFTFTPKMALAIAKMFHPTFSTLKPAIQTLLAKNVRLIMGKDLKSMAMFVLCWSEDGAETISEKSAKTGNVGHAIAIANHMKIPVFNLGKLDTEKRLMTYLGLSHE